MRRLTGFLFLIAAGLAAYTIFSDPERREKVFGTIEKSTGLDIEDEADKMVKEAGPAINRAADKLFKELSDTMSNPELRRSLERWGRDALKKLDSTELRQLKKDLNDEIARGTEEYEKILEKYLE